MFSSKTGWGATLVSLIGALTATDTLPMLSAFLTDTFGARPAHIVGGLLMIAGLLVAKLSHSTTPAAP